MRNHRFIVGPRPVSGQLVAVDDGYDAKRVERADGVEAQKPVAIQIHGSRRKRHVRSALANPVARDLADIEIIPLR